MRFPLAFIVGLLLACSPLLAQGKAVQATLPQILLARDRTEPDVAVDPIHPNIIVAGSNTNYDAPLGDLLPAAHFSSGDGGATFLQGNVPMLRPYTTAADPSVAVARDGTVFFSALGETPSYCSGGQSAVELTHSVDHGRSYRAPVVVDSNPADDKPLLAVESEPSGPSHIFVAWTRWHDQTSDIWIARSTDGGAHFGAPHMLFSNKLDNFGPVPVVGPHGRVYVFWTSFHESTLKAVMPSSVLMRASADDGVHFGSAHLVGKPFAAVPPMAQPGSLRNLPGPAAAVNAAGTVFVAWARVTQRLLGGAVNADIELVRSTDEGTSWSRPRRVNDARAGDRFMPALSAWGDGSVGVAFYDRRNGWGELDVYAARVTFHHRARRARNLRVNDPPSPTSSIYYIAPGSTCLEPGRFFGDYIGAATAPGHVLCVTWADAHRQVVNQTDVWFRKLAF